MQCVYDVQNPFYWKIYCKDLERANRIMEWIMSVDQPWLIYGHYGQRLREIKEKQKENTSPVLNCLN